MSQGIGLRLWTEPHPQSPESRKSNTKKLVKRGLEKLSPLQSSNKFAVCPGPCVVQYAEYIKGKEKILNSERKQITQKGRTLTLTVDITLAVTKDRGPWRNRQSALKTKTKINKKTPFLKVRQSKIKSHRNKTFHGQREMCHSRKEIKRFSYKWFMNNMHLIIKFFKGTITFTLFLAQSSEQCPANV